MTANEAARALVLRAICDVRRPQCTIVEHEAITAAVEPLVAALEHLALPMYCTCPSGLGLRLAAWTEHRGEHETCPLFHAGRVLFILRQPRVRVVGDR